MTIRKERLLILCGFLCLIFFIELIKASYPSESDYKYIYWLLFFLWILFSSKKNSFFNPYIFLLPVIPYYLVNLYFALALDEKLIEKLGALYLSAIVSFDLGLSFFGSQKQVTLQEQKMAAKNTKLLFALAIIVIVCNAALKLGVKNGYDVAKGLGLIFSPILWAVYFGALASVSLHQRFAGAFLVLIYSCYALWGATISEDASRYSFAMIMMIGLVYLVHIQKVLRPWSARLLFPCLLALTPLLIVIEGGSAVRPGGDALIITTAAEIVEKIDEPQTQYKPSMFFFNIGPSVVPRELWPVGDKPVAYNPNGWYLNNILGIDPQTYPWGVGVGGIGAAYLYGAVAGVIILYLAMGIFVGWLKYSANTPFTNGVYFYFLFLLPFAAFRMDDTFLWGLPMFSVPMLWLLLVWAKNKNI